MNNKLPQGPPNIVIKPDYTYVLGYVVMALSISGFVFWMFV